MATMMRDAGDMVLISTVVGPGKRKRLPRGGVLVPAADRPTVIAEIVRQAEKARALAGVGQK